jgi:hypothetical protein
LIPRNSPKIATTSNTLIVTCSIVILAAVLVFLELHIRRSIVHLHPTGAETWTDSPRETKQPKCMSAAREAVIFSFSFSNWLMPNEMNSQRNLTVEQMQSRAVNGEAPYEQFSDICPTELDSLRQQSEIEGGATAPRRPLSK